MADSNDQSVAELARFPRLKGLWLRSASELTDSGLACIEQLQLLEELIVEHASQLTRASLERISRHPKLKDLSWIYGAELCDDDLAALARSSTLTRLQLRQAEAAHASGPVGEPGIKLDLYQWPKLTLAGVKELARLPKLEQVTLEVR